MIAIGSIVSMKVIQRSPFCQYSCSTTTTKSSTSFLSWSEKWFNDTNENDSIKAPVFYCDSKNIDVLKNPEQFYNELKSLSSKATKRITLASLYLGNGDLEKELVDTIYETMSTSPTPIKFKVLLEYTRGSRGTVNSRTMLLPIVRKFVDDASVALFHTPNLRGVLKRIVPERFNETINVSHLKVYLFDDTLIMSGANLSNDYFTNRQDRYIVFRHCKPLCNYFDDLVETVSTFSFQLSPRDTVAMRPDFKSHPYLGSSKIDFNKEAGSLLKTFMRKYAVGGGGGGCDENYNRENFSVESIKRLRESVATSSLHPLPTSESQSSPAASSSGISTNGISSENSNRTSTRKANTAPLSSTQAQSSLTSSSLTRGSSNDTLVFPLLQMKTMGVDQDEIVTSNIIGTAPKDVSLVLATAYFNLTDSYWKALCRNDCADNRLIMAHPKAMGFYNAPGMAGGIPNAYSLISLRRYKDLVNKGQSEKMKFYEFHRHGWTFHGKGLWAHVAEIDSPHFLTLIGSPNFGKRSVYRDMEAQVGIVTVDKRLKQDLIEERDRFCKDSSRVTRATFDEKERSPAWWVWGIATFMNSFF